MHEWFFVQNLIHVNASIFECFIDAIFQVCLVEASMMVVPFFSESFVDVALLYVIHTILKTPSFGYFFPTFEGQFCGVV